jgi:hypothetical protein
MPWVYTDVAFQAAKPEQLVAEAAELVVVTTELATELLAEETVTTEEATLELVVEHEPRSVQVFDHAHPVGGA